MFRLIDNIKRMRFKIRNINNFKASSPQISDMGNLQRQQPRPSKMEQQVEDGGGGGGAGSTLDKELLFRFLGVRMVNEGDGYELPAWKEMKETPAPVAFDVADDFGRRLHNPGTVADVHGRCHDMLPQTFDGFRLNICRALSPQISVGHSLHLDSKSSLTNGCFSVSYSPERGSDLAIWAQTPQHPLIIAELDARGNLSGSLMHFMTPRLRGKVTASFGESQLQSTRVFVDYFGADCTCTCVLSKLTDQKTDAFVASYLQQVTPYLALGMDLIYQREDTVPRGGQAATVASAVARYHQDDRIWSAMLSPQALELCFTQIYGRSLGASVQLQANMVEHQATTRLCYHWHIPTMGFNFRGGIDTGGVISALCEQRLDPLPILLQLSGKLNHFSNRFHFGLGMVID